MISISSYSNITRSNIYKTIVPKFNGTRTSDMLMQGDKALNENRDKEALEAYKQALQYEPDNTEINRKIAKAYHKLKNYKSAEENFKIYLKAHNDDADVWIDLGESQRQRGHYSDAITSFETAIKLDNKNDLAKRSLMEAKNDQLSCISPQKAYEEKQAYAQKNLQEALRMTVEYMTPEYMSDLSDIQVKFGETAKMGGTSNIAQYENSIKTMTVSNAYIYAAPQVIAAYLVHESVHGKDKDPYTSIKEEQDAYQKATKFWLQYSGGIKDPEMDYAAELYKKSSETLNKRVEEIYLMRDPSIAKTSPNHPPEKKSFLHLTKKNNAASQSLKTYNAIA